MPSEATIISMDQIRSISDTWEQHSEVLGRLPPGPQYPEGYPTLGPVRIELNVMARAFSVREKPGAPIKDYYFIELEGSMSCHVGLKLSDTPVIYDIGIAPPNSGGFVFVDHSPTTTIGATSYSTNISRTYGGSVGFFGETPQASVDASITVGSSKSTTIVDVSVEDRSDQELSGDKVSLWLFDIAWGSQSMNSDTRIDVAALYEAPHRDAPPAEKPNPGPADASVTFSVFAGIRYPNGVPLDELRGVPNPKPPISFVMPNPLFSLPFPNGHFLLRYTKDLPIDRPPFLDESESDGTS
jgi:hypothetical protein